MDKEYEFYNLTRTSKDKSFLRKYRIYNLPSTKDYILTNTEETYIINQINNLLNEFEIQLNLLPLETIYYSIMPLGRKICESILTLVLKKEGYSITKYHQFYEIIQFSYKINIIPKNMQKNLTRIRIHANKAIHGKKPSYNEVLSFLNKFSKVIIFLNTSYFIDENLIFIENINEKIESLPQLSNKEKPKDYNKNPEKNKEYEYSQKEELEDMNNINKLLNDYENQLKIISDEKKYYYTFVGSTISELMVKLLLKKENYYTPPDNYSFNLMINILYDNHIIPRECYNFLQLIRKYRNEFIHGTEQSKELVISFLKAFNYLIQWFDNYYYQNYSRKFEIEECCRIINSLDFDENKESFSIKEKEYPPKIDESLKIHENQINEKIKQLTLEKTISERKQKEIKYEKNLNEKYKADEHKIRPGKLNYQINTLKSELKEIKEIRQKQSEEINSEILKKLDEYGKLFEKCIEIMQENNQTNKRIEDKLDNLHTKIDKISNNISTIQSLTERQINNAQPAEEVERIVETYIDECIDNIMKYSSNFIENKNYLMEKRKLIYSIGEDGWNKLSEKSKTFLITSKVMYNHLVTMDDIIDYSGICVLVTKALEVEIKKRFFTDFLSYLNKKYNANYNKYHTALLFKKTKPLISEKFTMGNIAFVMCYIENWNDETEEKTNNKNQLMDYCKNCIFSRYNESEIKDLLNRYASSIEEIRKKYRNPSTHTNEIKRIDAEECFNLVLDIEKLLKQMLDSFDY